MDFDPVEAEIWGPVRTSKPSGVQSATPALLFITRIKSPRGMYASESMNQGHSDSRGNCVIEVSALGIGDSLTADMWFMHRGTRYEIKGKLPTDWRTEMALYVCVSHLNPT